MVHALQEYQQQFLMELRISPQRVVVIPNGVDLDRFSPTEPTSPVKGFSVLFVGRLDAGKGIDVLLGAARMLDGADPPIVIRVAGDGPLRGLVEETALAYANVHYLGYVDDPASLYASSHLLVAPSRFESAPLAPAEALAAGLPLVMSDIPAHSAYASDKHAIMAPPSDRAALAAAITQWRDVWRREPESFAAAKVSARMLACHRFDAAKNLGELLETIEEVSSENERD